MACRYPPPALGHPPLPPCACTRSLEAPVPAWKPLQACRRRRRNRIGYDHEPARTEPESDTTFRLGRALGRSRAPSRTPLPHTSREPPCPTVPADRHARRHRSGLAWLAGARCPCGPGPLLRGAERAKRSPGRRGEGPGRMATRSRRLAVASSCAERPARGRHPALVPVPAPALSCYLTIAVGIGDRHLLNGGRLGDPTLLRSDPDPLGGLAQTGPLPRKAEVRRAPAPRERCRGGGWCRRCSPISSS